MKNNLAMFADSVISKEQEKAVIGGSCTYTGTAQQCSSGCIQFGCRTSTYTAQLTANSCASCTCSNCS